MSQSASVAAITTCPPTAVPQSSPLGIWPDGVTLEKWVVMALLSDEARSLRQYWGVRCCRHQGGMAKMGGRPGWRQLTSGTRLSLLNTLAAEWLNTI